MESLVRRTVPLARRALLMGGLASLGPAASPVPPESAATVPVTPLREVGTARFAESGTFLAWVEPALCDAKADVYLVLAPYAKPREVGAARAAGRDLPLVPRQVLRIRADGKQRLTIDPAKCRRLDGKQLTTGGLAVTPDGSPLLLVWATWGEAGKGAQYLVPFDSKGECRSPVEVDWHEILVEQFEVFGSGDYLVRGRRTETSEPRIAVLSADGTNLRDIVGWAGQPSVFPDDEAADDSPHRFDFMARGDDGRIFVAEQDPSRDEVVVYAFAPSGVTETLLGLKPMPRDRRLMGLRSSGGRIAAVYFAEGPEAESPSGEPRGRAWIAVYDSGAGGELQRLYGPAPGVPVCYERSGSEDRFTFVVDGDRLVTMAP